MYAYQEKLYNYRANLPADVLPEDVTVEVGQSLLLEFLIRPSL